MSAIILPGIAAQEVPVAGGFPIPAVTNRAGGVGAISTLHKSNAKPGATSTVSFSMVFYGAVRNHAGTDFQRILQIGNGTSIQNYTIQSLFNFEGANGGRFTVRHQELSSWGNNFFTHFTAPWVPVQGEESHIVYSCDAQAAVAHVMIDGVVVPITKSGAGGNFNVYWGTAAWRWAMFSAHTSTSADQGQFETLSFIAVSDTFHDLTLQAERDRFWNSALDLPIKPDTTANNLFGADSRFCIQGDETAWRAGDASGVGGFFNARTDTNQIVDDGTNEVV